MEKISLAEEGWLSSSKKCGAGADARAELMAVCLSPNQVGSQGWVNGMLQFVLQLFRPGRWSPIDYVR